ncbi:MAG: hypothetical protein COB20_01110 [SAR86 cluster bacterium]|uniref:Uncharacterized protein n=1 Tax=SAR86 cluster bacterium TaxID=2030880 RepID=A0A2A4XGY0_9GAMM|nr:MAG: hypothetical protein COB20_01110 [SAR86 cluster bacterium]
MNEPALLAGSRETLGITMLQKLVLASLVASKLLASNVAFADSAQLVADGVLVEKNPVVVTAAPEDGEVVEETTPALIGSAVNASYVSSDGWAVTGKDFIDAAVAVFDLNTTTSVSQATLTLPIEEIFAQNGVAPLEIYMYSDNGVVEFTDYSAGFTAAIAEIDAVGLTQINIDVTGAVNSALNTGQYVAFRVKSSVLPSTVSATLPAWTGVKFFTNYSLTFTPGAAPAIATDFARFDGYTLGVQNVEVAGIGEIALQMQMVDANGLIFQLTQAEITGTDVSAPTNSGAGLLNCSEFAPPVVSSVAIGASSYSVNSGILDVPSVNFNEEQLSLRLEFIEGSNPMLFETLSIGAVQSGPSEAIISALGGGLITESSQDFVPLCHGWVLIGDSVRNRVVERNLISGETGKTYSFGQIPDQFTVDVDNGTIFMTVHPETQRLYKLDLNTGSITSNNVVQNIAGFTYRWTLRDLALGEDGNVFALMFDNILTDPGEAVPFSSTGLWMGLMSENASFLTESIPLEEPVRIEYDNVLDHVFLATASNLATFDFDTATNVLTFVSGTDIAVGSSCTDFTTSPDGTRLAYTCPNGNRSAKNFSIVDMAPDDYFDSDGEWFLGSSPLSATFNKAGTILIATDNDKLYFYDVITHLILEDFELGLLEGETIKKIRISLDGNFLLIFLANEVHAESSKFYWMPMPAITGTPL